MRREDCASPLLCAEKDAFLSHLLAVRRRDGDPPIFPEAGAGTRHQEWIG